MPKSILIEQSEVFCSAIEGSHKVCSFQANICTLLIQRAEFQLKYHSLRRQPSASPSRDVAIPSRQRHRLERMDGADSPQDSMEAASDIHSKALQLFVLAERYKIPTLRKDMLAVLLTKLPMLCGVGDQKTEMSAALFLGLHMQPLETALGLEYMSEALYSAPWQRLVVERWNDKRPLADITFMWRYLGGIHEQLLERAQKLRDALRYEADTTGKLSFSQKPDRVRAIRHLGHLLMACATSHQPYYPRFVERRDRTLDLLQDTLFMRSSGCVEREDRMLDVWEDTLSLRSGDLLPASVLSTFGKRIRYE